MDLTAASPPVVALVADDEAFLRMEAADTLEEAGFKVLEVTSADAALRYLEENDGISLLFTDVNMPGSSMGSTLPERWPHAGRRS